MKIKQEEEVDKEGALVSKIYIEDRTYVCINHCVHGG